MDKNKSVLIDVMYREMFKKLWIYARNQLEDDGLAEEAVQEAFRIACEKEEKVLASENPRGWIMKALKYTILTIKRERAVLSRIYIHLEIEEKSAEISQDNIDLMYSDLISEEDFEILKTVVMEKSTVRDTAKKFGITVSACKKRLERIKQRLQYILSEERGGDGNG